jgi:hypothetical protein
LRRRGTQNDSGVHRRRGGQVGNGNARKRLAWVEGWDLSSPEGVDRFLREVIRRTWTGELGTRAAGALNGSIRILLEHLLLPSIERRIAALEAAKEAVAN